MKSQFHAVKQTSARWQLADNTLNNYLKAVLYSMNSHIFSFLSDAKFLEDFLFPHKTVPAPNGTAK